MVRLNLQEMTQEEKIATMEVLWADLSQAPEQVESPAWHKSALAEAEASVETGTAHFRPLSEVKQRMNETIS